MNLECRTTARAGHANVIVDDAAYRVPESLSPRLRHLTLDKSAICGTSRFPSVAQFIDRWAYEPPGGGRSLSLQSLPGVSVRPMKLPRITMVPLPRAPTYTSTRSIEPSLTSAWHDERSPRFHHRRFAMMSPAAMAIGIYDVVNGGRYVSIGT